MDNIIFIFIGLLAFSDVCKGVEKPNEERSNLEADSSYLVEQYRYLEGNDNDQRNEHAEKRDFDDDFTYRSSGISEKDEYDDWDDDKLNVVGLRRDDREDIVRPCSLDDWRCIRKFFAKNSNCKPSFGPISDPLYLRRTTFYIPSVNVSLISTRLRVSGQSQIKISELYHNKDTGNLVLGLEFQKINLTTPKAYFRYHRTAKESIVLDDFGTVAVGGTITAIIPKIPNLRLDLAEIHVFINDRLPPFSIGPGAVSTGFVNSHKLGQVGWCELTNDSKTGCMKIKTDSQQKKFSNVFVFIKLRKRPRRGGCFYSIDCKSTKYTSRGRTVHSTDCRRCIYSRKYM